TGCRLSLLPAKTPLKSHSKTLSVINIRIKERNWVIKSIFQQQPVVSIYAPLNRSGESSGVQAIEADEPALCVEAPPEHTALERQPVVKQVNGGIPIQLMKLCFAFLIYVGE